MEGSRLPIVKRLTKAGNRYDISPMRDFDLAVFFGLTASSEGFDPPPVDSSTPNPPRPSLPGLNTAPIGSAHDVESDDDDLY